MIESNSIISQNNERILVIDDEEPVGLLTKAILEFSGYEVIFEPGGVEAVKTFRRKPSSFDLVITDQSMPLVSGFDVAHEVVRIRPDIPIIMCSGAPPDKSHPNMSLLQAFILKPFSGEEFVKTVRDVLDMKGERRILGRQD